MAAPERVPPAPSAARIGWLHHPAAKALAMGGLTGLLFAARLTLGGEFWLDRTYWLAGLLVANAVLAAALAERLLARLAGGKRLLLQRWLAAMLFAICFMIFSALFLGFYQSVIRAPELHPNRPIRSFLVTYAAGVVGFFVSSPTYLLPWMMPLMMLAAAWLLPRRKG